MSDLEGAWHSDWPSARRCAGKPRMVR
nr:MULTISPECIES: hypothetical protein [Sinorhizobium]